MDIKHKIGTNGEDIAEKYLIQKGYKIIERNFRCRQGEIDIIAKDKNEIIFIEVKTRTNTKYGQPIDSITYFKKNHIVQSIKYYLYLNKLENEYIRIDVIEILLKSNKYYINHIKNAI